MNLNEYLSLPGSLSVSELRARMTRVKSDAQIRQWQHGYNDRLPGPANCVELEHITEGAIRRWDLRPNDWHLIWPELIGTPGAPRVKVIRHGVSRKSTAVKAEPAPAAQATEDKTAPQRRNDEFAALLERTLKGHPRRRKDD